MENWFDCIDIVIITGDSLASNTSTASVTRSGDFLHFGQLFKACGNN